MERKFDVGESDELPVFTSIAGVDHTGPVQDQKLDAVYFDTATFALAARRITLRRRTGGKDPGWHLKLPLAGWAQKKARGTVGLLVNAERKRLKGAVKSVDDDGGADEASGNAALHEVRKSAKRLRYAAEAAVPVFGNQAVRLARTAEEVQAILGDHQDSVVIREKLMSLAGASPEGGRGNGFTYGRLHALEQQRGAEARTLFLRTWQHSPSRPLRWK